MTCNFPSLRLLQSCEFSDKITTGKTRYFGCFRLRNNAQFVQFDCRGQAGLDCECTPKAHLSVIHIMPVGYQG